MENIKVKNLGPIASADIDFGSLTLFVGPQASGKSILLQLIKLLIDKNSIENTLDNYGFVWGNKEDRNLDRFFGEGMSQVWSKTTKITFDDRIFEKEFLLAQPKGPKLGEDNLFYIPSRRVVCLNYGWPRFFTDYEDSVPFVLREFSETLRQYLETGFTHGESSVFPQPGLINAQLEDSFNNGIFHGGEITVEQSAKKRLKLNVNNLDLPFMTWSAGQKEFMPLLLAFYWLCPVTISRRRNGIDYVVIEEPEMGLHPQAIKSVILQILDLMARGYKIIVSTHSPVLLEFAWAFNILKTSGGDASALARLFDLEDTTQGRALINGQLEHKTINTYYFDNSSDKVTVKNISTLDAGDADPIIAEWGVLSSFASKAAEIVSTIVANNG
jgi:AAA15 family ATPase/GTPase